MLIFYVKQPNPVSTLTTRNLVNNSASVKTFPVVIIDAMSSDDRFSTKEIQLAVNTYAPENVTLATPSIFSCEYTAQFEHAGIPLGASIKTRFSGTLKSPPAALVDAF